MPRRKWGIASTTGLLLFVVIACFCGLLVAFNRTEILHLGQRRFITFSNDWYDIDSCLRKFQIRENFIRLAYDGCSVQFCDEPNHNEYKAIHADNGDLIGILDYALDSPLLIMYDFSSGQCWPCGASNEQRDNLFNRLKRENPELQKPDYWQR